MKKSFVSRRVPPGWMVSELERNHDRPGLRWWARCAGKSVYREAREEACRSAWQIWAIEILGDGVRWDEEPDDGMDIGTCLSVFSENSWQRICLVHWLSDHEWELSHEMIGVDNCESICFSSFETDPVEALVRMAALSLSLHGANEINDGEND